MSDLVNGVGSEEPTYYAYQRTETGEVFMIAQSHVFEECVHAAYRHCQYLHSLGREMGDLSEAGAYAVNLFASIVDRGPCRISVELYGQTVGVSDLVPVGRGSRAVDIRAILETAADYDEVVTELVSYMERVT